MDIVTLVGVDILVPARVEAQQRLGDGVAVVVVVVHFDGTALDVIGTLAEVAQHIDRVLVVVQTVKLLRSSQIEVRCREAVEQR